MGTMDAKFQNTYRNRIIFAVLGFGLAGSIWGGWDLYGGASPADYPLTILGAILFGVLGGVGLALPVARSATKIGKIVGLGLIGSVVGFIAAWLGIYNLSILGGSIIAFFPIPASAADFFGVGRMPISTYWLNFTLAGGFMGLFFALGLRKKILPMILRGALGFGLAAIIGPILGNTIGNLFNSLFASYVATFMIIGVVFGLSLTLRLNKKEKEGSTAQ